MHLKKQTLTLIPFLAMAFGGMAQNHYWLPNAQQQPQMVFPLWIESGDGQTDVLYFGYDAEAKGGNPNGADSIFGEGYELVDTSKFVAYIYSLGSILDSEKVHKRDIADISEIDGKSYFIEADIRFLNVIFPIKVTWDPSLFYSDSLPFHVNEGWPQGVPKAIGEIWCGTHDADYKNCLSTFDPSFIFPSDPLNEYFEHGKTCSFGPPLSLPYYGEAPCIADIFNEVIFYGDTSLGSPNWMFFWFYVKQYGQPTSIEPIKSEIKPIKISPNPAYDKLVISSGSRISKTSIFELFNPYGQLVRVVPLAGGQTVLEIGDLPSGVYFYRVINQDQQLYSGKLIIDKI